MVYSNFDITVVGNQVLFKNASPIENVEFLKYYKDDATGTFNKKEFRWSFDNNYWASWTTLNQGNVSGLSMNANKFLYLEIRYIKSNSSADVCSFSLNYTELTGSNSCGVTPPSTPAVCPKSN